MLSKNNNDPSASGFKDVEGNVAGHPVNRQDIQNPSKGQKVYHCLRFRDITKVTQGIVAHEAFHAAMSFCNYLGITFTTEDNEHVAYVLQWIVNKCFETKWTYEKELTNGN